MPKPQIITKTVTITEKQPIICPDVPKLAKLVWKDIIWIVATSDNGLKVLGLDEAQYKNLAENTSNSLKAIQDRNLILNYYLMCIRDFNEGYEE